MRVSTVRRVFKFIQSTQIIFIRFVQSGKPLKYPSQIATLTDQLRKNTVTLTEIELSPEPDRCISYLWEYSARLS